MKNTLIYILPFALWILFISNGCKSKSGNSENTATEETYTCPMHPQIIRHEPGNCPICGMPLVKKVNASREISNISLSTVLQSNNNTVISSIPVTTMKFSQQKIQLEALGSVNYDTRFMKTIASRVGGRIEKLYVKYRYQPIHTGDKIMDIYSPELLTGQQNLLFLVKNDPTNTTLINAAKQRLLLLGMTENQVDKIIATHQTIFSVSVYSPYSGHVHEAGNMNESESINNSMVTQELSVKEGMYVQKGEPVLQVNNMNHVFVNLNFFPGETSLIKEGTPVTIIAETAPDKKIFSKIDFIEPFYKNKSKTVSARVYLNNSKLMIPVGSQVKATVNVDTKAGNWLPKESVLSLGLNKIVFLKRGDVFKAQPITTGISTNNLIEITSGLNAKDSVATNAQFLIDSEGFINVK
ncbi:MAG TPA: efflux RND transporter periplasmic adaptor subunit [Hanamia sp.]|nr:efflux RND transporter periplasmic adaptor subunit [Hanamia sp.]